MAKAKPIKVGNSGRKLVLMMLADISDDSGRCFPSYQHLADVCEMSRRSVITHILNLQEKGLLKITHRKLKGELINSSNIYHLTLEQASKPDETGSENSALGSEMVALGSETVALGGSEMVAPITYHSSEPINEPIKEKAHFIKPLLSDISQYMANFSKSQNITFDDFLPDNFFDYYESNGWKRGNHEIKDWQATARGWVRKQNNKLNGGQNAGQNNKPANNSAPARVRAINAAKQAQRDRTERTIN